MPITFSTAAASHCASVQGVGPRMDLTADQLVPPGDPRLDALRQLLGNGNSTLVEFFNDFDPAGYADDVACEDLVQRVLSMMPVETKWAATADTVALYANLNHEQARELAQAMGPLRVDQILGKEGAETASWPGIARAVLHHVGNAW